MQILKLFPFFFIFLSNANGIDWFPLATSSPTQEAGVSEPEAEDKPVDLTGAIQNLEVRIEYLMDEVASIRANTQEEKEPSVSRAEFAALLATVEALSEQIVGLTQSVEGLTAPSGPSMNPWVDGRRVRVEGDRRDNFLRTISSVIPLEITRSPREIDVYQFLEALREDLSQGNFLRQFQALSEAGQDAHFIIGEPTQSGRPIWIELHTQRDVSIIHPAIDPESAAGLTSRESLPQTYNSGLYGLAYDEAGSIVFYRLDRDE